MKHLKTFENKDKYLNKEDTDKLEKFIVKFITNVDFESKINNLQIPDFYDEGYDYKKIFNNFLTSKYLESKNVYYATENFAYNNNIEIKTPKYRNTTYKIIDDIYEKLKNHLKNIIDKKLIELLKNSSYDMKPYVSFYENRLNDVVKYEWERIKDMKKYNL